MPKINCASFVWFVGDRMLTDSFCEQCPEYINCSGSLTVAELRRLFVEDGWKLQKMA